MNDRGGIPMKEYPVQRAAVLKPKPDPDTLVFG